MTWWARIKALWSAWRNPVDAEFDTDFPDSLTDIDCPDTQPTAPGLLDTL